MIFSLSVNVICSMFIFSFIYEKNILGNVWKYLSENEMLLVG